jgi:Rrf2 family protein
MAMHVPAKVDYAVRSMLELADAHPVRLSREELARRQNMPTRYLEAILRELANSGLVAGHRGVSGGYELSRPASEITIADVSRAVDGPLALVGHLRPGQVTYDGTAQHLGELWVGLRAAIRSLMEHVTLADLLDGTLPPSIRLMVEDADAWLER